MLLCEYPVVARTTWNSLASDKPSPLLPLLPSRKSFCCSPRLITKKNKKICVSPTDDAVLKLLQQLDKKAKNDKDKKAKNNKNKRQIQRPRGRPKKQKRQRV